MTTDALKAEYGSMLGTSLAASVRLTVPPVAPASPESPASAPLHEVAAPAASPSIPYAPEPAAPDAGPVPAAEFSTTPALEPDPVVAETAPVVADSAPTGPFDVTETAPAADFDIPPRSTASRPAIDANVELVRDANEAEEAHARAEALRTFDPSAGFRTTEADVTLLPDSDPAEPVASEGVHLAPSETLAFGQAVEVAPAPVYEATASSWVSSFDSREPETSDEDIPEETTTMTATDPNVDLSDFDPSRYLGFGAMGSPEGSPEGAPADPDAANGADATDPAGPESAPAAASAVSAPVPRASGASMDLLRELSTL
jgi:hypothetical protein